jgi:hypothetical protein
MAEHLHSSTASACTTSGWVDADAQELVVEHAGHAVQRVAITVAQKPANIAPRR